MAAAAGLIQACAGTPAPTSAPAAPTTAPTSAAAAPTATAEPAAQYKEAPMLAELVKAGKLPPVKDRVGDEPQVVTPVEEIGQYGGTWHRMSISQGDIRTPDRLMYDNLIRWDKNGAEMVPNVAKSWEVSPDGKSFTFRLRKGMKWSDGAPFGADDLMFYFVDHCGNADLTPSFPAGLTSAGEPVKAEKLDDYSVRLSFTGVPHGLFMVVLASGDYGYALTMYPKHYAQQFHPNYVEKTKLDAAVKAAGFEAWYQLYGNKVGSNPTKTNVELPVIHAWKMTQPPPAIPAIMERNPYYWKVDTAGNQLPYIDKMEHLIVENAQAVNLQAIAGNVDMQLRHMLFSNYPLFQDGKEKGDYRILQWTRGYVTDAAICPGLAHADPVMRQILGQKELRWALSLGIKRDEIIQAIYLGMAEPNQVSPLKTSPFYWEEQAKNLIEYDPARANSLLDGLGYTQKDGDGYRLRPDGKRLSLVFEYTAAFGSWGDIGELLAANWKEIGIELIVKEIARELLYERKLAGTIDITMWTGSAELNPLIDPNMFLPQGDSFNAMPFANWYNTGGKDGEEPTGDLRQAQKLYDEIKASVDIEKQKALFRQILEMNKENLWVIGICTAPPELVIVKNKFRNVPESAVSDWQLLTPGNTMPEQYFWKS